MSQQPWQPNQQFQQQPPVQKDPKESRRKANRIMLSIILAICTFIVGIMIGSSGSDSPSASSTATTTATAWVTKTATASAAAAAPAKASDDTIGEGTFQVGSDVKAGTYEVTVPSDSDNCYWSRSKDSSGNVDSIIANDNLNPGAHGTVTLKKGETFETTGCGTWVHE